MEEMERYLSDIPDDRLNRICQELYDYHYRTGNLDNAAEFEKTFLDMEKRDLKVYSRDDLEGLIKQEACSRFHKTINYLLLKKPDYFFNVRL